MRRILVAAAVLAAGCALPGGKVLQSGISTERDVLAAMGPPAEIRPAPGGERVLWYPRHPWGHASYAARVGADGKLAGLEQRLTEENIKKVQRGATTMAEVRDLLGPPWDPLLRPHREIWTYPMRIAGDLNPKYFVVQMSREDGIVREAFLMDDPQFQPKDTPGVLPR